MSEFLMPSLGADMDAGTLVEWLVEPGAPVKRGDIIAVIETQKGAIEIEIFEDGIFERSLVEVGEKVPVGTPLAMITHPGEIEPPAPAPEVPPLPPQELPLEVPTPEIPVPEPEPPTPLPPEVPAPPQEPVPPQVPAPPSGPEPAPVPPPDGAMHERLRVSPVARRLAAQSGIDLASLAGTGPHGSIVLADVEARIGRPAAAPAPAPAETGDAMSGMRAAIAAAMARSKREIPHYYLADTIDLTKAQAWLTARNAGREPAERALMGALFIKAVANALKKYPEFNGHFEDGVYQASPAVHVGVAINIRGGGLVAPAIHNAETLDLDTLMEKMRDLVTRVRAGRFRGSELSDPTITISSLGERGVESLYGVIYPPQVAIIGFGTPVMRPWVDGDVVDPRQVVTVTLAADHRVSDGHRGALFLNAIEHQLLEPETL